MPGVIPVYLVRQAQRCEPSQVVVDLPDGAPWVVLPGQDQYRRRDLLDVGEGRRLAVAVRDLLRRATEQGTVERLQTLHLVLVGGDVVRDGHRGDRDGPVVRLRTDAEQCEEPTP